MTVKYSRHLRPNRLADTVLRWEYPATCVLHISGERPGDSRETAVEVPGIGYEVNGPRQCLGMGAVKVSGVPTRSLRCCSKWSGRTDQHSLRLVSWCPFVGTPERQHGGGRHLAKIGESMVQVYSLDHAGVTYSGVVELHVPTNLDQLAVVRAVAEAIATKENFGPDAVADVKLAVDEAASCLMSHATLGARLHCRYDAAVEALDVTVSTTCAPGVTAHRHGFGWQVLTTLTDSLSVDQAAEAPGTADRATSIRFRRLRRPGRR